MSQLDTVFEREVRTWFDEEIAANPMAATYLGIHTYDHLLGDYSRPAIEERAVRARIWLETFLAFDPADLSPDHRIDRLLLKATLTTNLEDHALEAPWITPSLYPELCVTAVYMLLMYDHLPLEQRMASMAGRLEQVPTVLAQGRSNITRPPRIFTEIALQVAKGGVAFLSTLIPQAAAQVPHLEARVLAANGKAIAAMTEYVSFLETDVLPRSDGEFAVGRHVFERRLRETHFLDYNADTLEAAGRQLIELTQLQMEKLARELDPARTWQQIVDEAKQLHPTAETLLDTYRAEMKRTRDFVIANDLVDLPANEVLEVVETPAFMRALIPYAAYEAPAPFEPKQKGFYFVTPVDTTAPEQVQQEMLEGHNSLSIPLTSLHEGYPGHHTQLSTANLNPSLVRKLAGFSTLFAEGWAFYCEELMESLGYLSDPRAKLLRLKDQLWRACRIVIDVGLHCKQMTLDEAAQMLVDVAKLEPVNARAEVTRYTMNPTQPMSYLIGKLEILKLADEYRARQGKAFSLKQFHTDLLKHGTIAPALVRELMFAK